MASNQNTVRNHGWSPELLTVLGAMLAIGVGLAGLILNAQAQVREDMRAMETRIRADMASMGAGIRADMASMEAGIRADMGAMEMRIREDMGAIETRIREDVRELRSDVVQVRERVSHLEGRFDRDGVPTPLPGDTPSLTSRS